MHFVQEANTNVGTFVIPDLFPSDLFMFLKLKIYFKSSYFELHKTFIAMFPGMTDTAVHVES
jgi:hypothetical protein